jgi:hypothetical protein
MFQETESKDAPLELQGRYAGSRQVGGVNERECSLGTWVRWRRRKGCRRGVSGVVLEGRSTAKGGMYCARSCPAVLPVEGVAGGREGGGRTCRGACRGTGLRRAVLSRASVQAPRTTQHEAVGERLDGGQKTASGRGGARAATTTFNPAREGVNAARARYWPPRLRRQMHCAPPKPVAPRWDAMARTVAGAALLLQFGLLLLLPLRPSCLCVRVGPSARGQTPAIKQRSPWDRLMIPGLQRSAAPGQRHGSISAHVSSRQSTLLQSWVNTHLASGTDSIRLPPAAAFALCGSASSDRCNRALLGQVISAVNLLLSHSQRERLQGSPASGLGQFKIKGYPFCSTQRHPGETATRSRSPER